MKDAGKLRSEEFRVWDQRRTLADVGVSQVSVGVLVEETRTLLALPAHGVVLTVVAHAPAHVAGHHEHGEVKVARCGVMVTITP